MYTVTELSKIFGVSRNTIYAKFATKELAQHVKQTEQGKRLDQEGFGVLQLTLSTSKTAQVNTILTPQNEHENEKSVNSETYIDKYIESLEKQIEELKKEKQDIQSKYDGLINVLIEQQTAQQKLLSTEKPPKKKWFDLFK